MMGDGKTSYDHDHDNEQGEIAGCSVSLSRRSFLPSTALTTGKLPPERCSYQSTNHLRPGKVPHSRPAVESGERMEEVLRN